MKASLNILCLLQNVTYNCFSQTVEQTFLIETVYYLSVYRFIILRPPKKTLKEFGKEEATLGIRAKVWTMLLILEQTANCSFGSVCVLMSHLNKIANNCKCQKLNGQQKQSNLKKGTSYIKRLIQLF